MANYTIVKRNGKAGTKYRCLVRQYIEGKEESESRTFTKNSLAVDWGKKRVYEIERSSVKGASTKILLHVLINKYLEDPYVEVGRSKKYSLDMISDCDIGQLSAGSLKAHNIVNFCKDRASAGAGSATVAVDISNLRSVLKVAKSLWGYEIDERAIVEAMPTLHRLNLVAKSKRRSRRLVDNELERLKESLIGRQARSPLSIPFAEILDFSILSCMRVGEVCRILWADLDIDVKAVLVRDRKDPRKKIGNDMVVPLLGGAFEIVIKQPKTEERIFPYKSTTVTAAFQRERNKLGIKDLSYRDLRREGASRLFEKKFAIDQVAQVTGHRDINTLWRVYTELYPKRLHDLDVD